MTDKLPFFMHIYLSYFSELIFAEILSGLQLLNSLIRIDSVPIVEPSLIYHGHITDIRV